MGEDFSNRFRRARMSAGLKATELAKLLGISASYISMIESGKKAHVSENILTAAAEKMNVSVKFLLSGVDTSAGVRENSGHYGSHDGGCARCDELSREVEWLRAALDAAQHNVSAALAASKPIKPGVDGAAPGVVSEARARAG
jgi:transcriptional regulator with XRE-family HTH domain